MTTEDDRAQRLAAARSKLRHFQAGKESRRSIDHGQGSGQTAVDDRPVATVVAAFPSSEPIADRASAADALVAPRGPQPPSASATRLEGQSPQSSATVKDVSTYDPSQKDASAAQYTQALRAQARSLLEHEASERSDLEVEVAHLKTEVESAKRNVEIKRLEADQAKSQLAATIQTLREQHETDLAQTRRGLDEAKAETDHLRAQVLRLEEEATASRAADNRLQTKLAASQETVDAMTAANDAQVLAMRNIGEEAANERDAAARLRTELAAALESVEAVTAAHEAEVLALRKAADDAADGRDVITSLRKELADAQEHTASLIATHEAEVSTLKKSNEEITRERDAALESVRSLTAAHEKEMTALRKASSETADEHATSERLRSQLAAAEEDARANAAAYESQILHLRKMADESTAELVKTHEQTKHEAAALASAIETMNATLEAERGNRTRLEEAFARDQTGLDELAMELVAQKEAAEAANQNLAEAQRSLESLNEDKRVLQEDLVQLQKLLAEHERAKAEQTSHPSSEDPRPEIARSAASGASRPSTPSNPVDAGKDAARRLTALQAEHLAVQSELARLRLSQADIGTLLLRTGSAPSHNETIATYQRRCEELAALVQTTQTEGSQLRNDIERLKTAVWAAERSEAKFAEVQGELASLREGTERERELWKGREDMMKTEVSGARSEVETYVRLLEHLCAQVQEGLRSDDLQEPTDATKPPFSRGGSRSKLSAASWQDGAIEKAIASLIDEMQRLRAAEKEAHQIMDLQHRKIEDLLGDRLDPPASTFQANGTSNGARSERHILEAKQPIPREPGVPSATQTDPMLSFIRLETLKARLSESGVIWKLARTASAGSIDEARTASPGSPSADADVGTGTGTGTSSSTTHSDRRVGALAATHAQLQTAHSKALSHVNALEQSLGHAKRLVVALTTGDLYDEDGRNEGSAEDSTLWLTRLVEKESRVFELEAELTGWRTRCEELEELVEEWSLGSSGGSHVGSPVGIQEP
ncbi:hypothetical protein HKX48_000639 [Thoreauomyces humboldtii]|nr:hypothetical protein HKX48_000639 [Thoreauomyces humboldtii]